MRKIIFLAVTAVVLHSVSNATIRRVGFFAPPVSGTDYSTFALAYTASASGDTILVFPGIPAISQTFTKKIIVIGPGSWLDPANKGNANMQAFAGSVSINSIIFNAGSEGSQLWGLENGIVYIGASNINIRRNREIGVYIAYTNPAGTTTNIQLLENYRLTVQNYYSNGSSVTNLNISNNLFTAFATGAGNTYNGNISNNVWAFDQTLSAANNGGATTLSSASNIDFGGGAYLFQNNILACYTSATAGSNYNYFGFSNSTNTVANNNMALQAASGPSQVWPVGTGNVVTPIANAANIFDGFPAISTFSADARYMLKAGSPALTVGAGSTPIGIYTGNTPYKLSMIPSIPSIYQLSSPQGNNPPGNTIQINVSTRGNN